MPRNLLCLFAAAAVCAALISVYPQGVSAQGRTSQGLRCADLQTTPRVVLRQKPGRIVQSNGFSRNQLEAFRQRGGAGASSPGWFTIGLTRRGLRTEIRVSVEGSRIGNSFCAALSAVDVTLGYDKIQVYIDRKYRPGTCEYQAVLDHELQHVKNFTDTLARYVPVIRDQLIQDAHGLEPIRVSGLRRGARKFQEILARRLEPLFDQMEEEMNEADDILDTPESYAANQARCDNW